MDFLDTICYSMPERGDHMATKIGERIMKRRQQLGWTQEDLALRMGYKTKSAINKIELGINDVSQSKVVKFAEVLNTTIAYLMDWEEDEVPEKLQEKNDAAVGIVKRLGSDPDFCEAVKLLYKLDSDQLKGVQTMLKTFLK